MPDIEPSLGTGPVIDRSTATEAATRVLRALILSGEMSAGARLRQDDLARRLGVSRTPLREALQRLEAEGLVRLDVHKSAVVAKPSFAQVSEIFELQEMLEIIAGRAAVQHRSPSRIAELRDVLDAHMAVDEPLAWATGNADFHGRLYEISERPLLIEIIGLLRNRSGLYVHMMARSPQRRHRADREHREMLVALEAGNAAQLEKLIRQHLRGTLSWLKEVIDE